MGCHSMSDSVTRAYGDAHLSHRLTLSPIYTVETDYFTGNYETCTISAAAHDTSGHRDTARCHDSSTENGIAAAFVHLGIIFFTRLVTWKG